jgi:hypothetical protein
MRGKGTIVPPCYSRGGKFLPREKVDATSSSRYDDMEVDGNGKRNKKRKCLEELVTTGRISVLLNDGPALGREFDSLPSGEFLSLL